MFEKIPPLPIDRLFIRPRQADDSKRWGTAVLFHCRVSLRVTWGCDTLDPRLVPGVLVSLRWGDHLTYANNAFHIQHLDPVEAPDVTLRLPGSVSHCCDPWSAP